MLLCPCDHVGYDTIIHLVGSSMFHIMLYHRKQRRHTTLWIGSWGFRSSAAAESSLLGCDMVLLGESSLCFKGSQCLHTQSEASTWSWMHCDALRHSELLTQWNSITPQEALIFIVTFHWKLWGLTYEPSDINATRVLTRLQVSLQPSKGSRVKIKLRTEGLVSFWMVSFLTWSEDRKRWKISSVNEVIIAEGNKKNAEKMLLLHQWSNKAGVQAGLLCGKLTCYCNDMTKDSYTEWYIRCTNVWTHFRNFSVAVISWEYTSLV